MYSRRISMIKRKNNAYRLIKANTPKLALIHHATGFSPNRLASLFLKVTAQEDLVIQKKTKDGFWDWKLADDTAYNFGTSLNNKNCPLTIHHTFKILP